MEQETIITIDPNLRNDVMITGEKGLATLCAMVRASWESNQPVIITAKRVIFKPDEE